MTVPPLDITIVYSASGRQRRRESVAHTYRAARGGSLLLLGALNLIAAGAMYYGIWWRVDPFLYVRFIMRGYLPGVDLDQAANIFGPRLPSSEEAQLPPEPEQAPATGAAYTGQTGNIIIGATAYSWLTLSSIASGAVALASGTMLGRAGGLQWRRAGLFMMFGLLVVLGLAGYGVWAKFGMQYRPSQLRVGMGGLVLLAALLGLAMGRGVRGWTLTASVLMILSAVGSAVGLYLGTLCGLITPDELPFRFVYFTALVFALHSLWGWILLATAPRLGR